MTLEGAERVGLWLQIGGVISERYHATVYMFYLTNFLNSNGLSGSAALAEVCALVDAILVFS